MIKTINIVNNIFIEMYSSEAVLLLAVDAYEIDGIVSGGLLLC